FIPMTSSVSCAAVSPKSQKFRLPVPVYSQVLGEFVKVMMESGPWGVAENPSKRAWGRLRITLPLPRGSVAGSVVSAVARYVLEGFAADIAARALRTAE